MMTHWEQVCFIYILNIIKVPIIRNPPFPLETYVLPIEGEKDTKKSEIYSCSIFYFKGNGLATRHLFLFTYSDIDQKIVFKYTSIFM